MRIDVRKALDVISVPTLVLHHSADRWVRVEHGRYLAQHIPGAEYAELDGGDHIPSAHSAPGLLAPMMPFLKDAAGRDVPKPDKVLATVMFSASLGRPRGRPSSGTRGGGNCSPSTTREYGGSWRGFAA